MRERNSSSATPPSGSPRPGYTLFGSGQRNANRKGRGKKKPIDMTTIVREWFWPSP